MQPLELTKAGKVVACATELQTVWVVFRAGYNAYDVTRVATRALGFSLPGEVDLVEMGDSGSYSSEELLDVRIGGLG